VRACVCACACVKCTSEYLTAQSLAALLPVAARVVPARPQRQVAVQTVARARERHGAVGGRSRDRRGRRGRRRAASCLLPEETAAGGNSRGSSQHARAWWAAASVFRRVAMMPMMLCDSIAASMQAQQSAADRRGKVSPRKRVAPDRRNHQSTRLRRFVPPLGRQTPPSIYQTHPADLPVSPWSPPGQG